MRIRRAAPQDAEALALVGAATLLESYCLDLPGPDIVRHCAKTHVAEAYAAWIKDTACGVWVVEIGEGVVVGYAVTTPSELPEAREGDLELRRIYLLARFRGRGTGRRLLETVAEEARTRGAVRLTLGMYGENHAALAFYTRLGFEVIGARTFQVGAKLCEDHVLGLALS